jgi:hypothetical protein
MSEIQTIFVYISDAMVKIDIQVIEDAIVQEIQKLKEQSIVSAETTIDEDCKPGMVGASSNVLVTITGWLEEVLNVEIPNNCYIFRDSDGIRELNIREAAEKLQKIAKPCKATT